MLCRYMNIMKERVDSMLKSMTGFGRCEVANEERKITVEMKAVNHRYLDMSIKLPKKLVFFETRIRNEVKQYVSRGKVDVFITYEDYTGGNTCVKYNESIAKEYMHYFEQMSKEFLIKNDVCVSALSRYPEVLMLEEQSLDETELWEFIKEPVGIAAKHLMEARMSEGEHLKDDLFDKLEELMIKINFIEERAPQILLEYQQKIKDKVSELLGDTKVDETILATELTIFADKICVDEETVRLKSHVQNMKETLSDGDNIGRKLDFIAQEMNREANTILSKANDLNISNVAIDIKTEIEKIREQIQNIE